MIPVIMIGVFSYKDPKMIVRKKDHSQSQILLRNEEGNEN
jgi:hypothetical protein